MGKSPSRQVITLSSLVAIGFMVVKMLLVCHVISQDHVVKGSGDFTSGIPSWKVTTLPSLVAIDIVVEEICF